MEQALLNKFVAKKRHKMIKDIYLKDNIYYVKLNTNYQFDDGTKIFASKKGYDVWEKCKSIIETNEFSNIMNEYHDIEHWWHEHLEKQKKRVNNIVNDKN